MKKKLGFLLLAFLGCGVLNAQVGIGNNSPHADAILDLKNGNNRGFLLPKTISPSPTGPFGIMYIDTNHTKIVYKDRDGYNALGAWRHFYTDTATSSNVYYNFNGNVGIGTASPLRKLHLKADGEAFAIQGQNTSAYIGIYGAGFNSSNKAVIGFNGSEALTIKNFTQNQNLSLETSGTGIVKSNKGIEVESGHLNVAAGKVMEKNDTLVPRGIITMWYGDATNVPNGWAICDGTEGTPDLRERFIVGAGDNTGQTPETTNYGAYTPKQIGGDSHITLTNSEVPKHTHAGLTAVAGNHSHTYTDNIRNITSDGGGSGLSERAHNGVQVYVTASTSTEGNHQHSFTTSVQPEGDGSHENRPPYIALVFIMKQ